MAIVYIITCKTTGKIYVGWTKRTLLDRWKAHLWADRNCYLQHCLRKYGKENFSIEAIFECERDAEAITKEIQLIKDMRLNISRHPDGIGMNMTDGGEGTIGYKTTPEHKDNLSKSMKGVRKSARHIENMRRAKAADKNPMHGREPTEAQRRSARARFTEHNPNQKGERSHRYGKPSHMRGKKHSSETIEKIRARLKGKKRRPHTDETKEKLRSAVVDFLAKNGHPGLGKKRSEESRLRMRAARLAYCAKQQKAGIAYAHSPETKEKMSRAARNRAIKASQTQTTNRKEYA